MVKQIGSIRFDVEDLKSISICDLFYKVALDTTKPLLKTKNGNKYILVAIDHYSKWCEAKHVLDHTTSTTTKFLEEEIIYRYEVPKFVLIDNGANGQLSLINFAKCTIYTISTLHPKGRSAMVWLKGWLKP